jgi:hypothetical protein
MSCYFAPLHLCEKKTGHKKHLTSVKSFGLFIFVFCISFKIIIEKVIGSERIGFFGRYGFLLSAIFPINKKYGKSLVFLNREMPLPSGLKGQHIEFLETMFVIGKRDKKNI